MPEGEENKEINLGTMQSVAVLIFNEHKDKVLLVKHTNLADNFDGIYGLPGGKIKLGEAPKETAARELVEETGLKTKEEDLKEFDDNFFGSYIIRTKGSVLRHAHMRVYHCTAHEGQLKGDTKTIPEWVDVETVKKWEEEEKKSEEEEEKTIWERKKLMPNIANAINNYLHPNE